MTRAMLKTMPTQILPRKSQHLLEYIVLVSKICYSELSFSELFKSVVSSIPPKFNKNAYLMQMSEETSYVKLSLVWVKQQFSYSLFFISSALMMNNSKQLQLWFFAIQENWHIRSKRNSTDSQLIFQTLGKKYSLVEFLTVSMPKSWKVSNLLILSLEHQEESKLLSRREILIWIIFECSSLMNVIRCLMKSICVVKYKRFSWVETLKIDKSWCSLLQFLINARKPVGSSWKTHLSYMSTVSPNWPCMVLNNTLLSLKMIRRSRNSSSYLIV